MFCAFVDVTSITTLNILYRDINIYHKKIRNKDKSSVHDKLERCSLYQICPGLVCITPNVLSKIDKYMPRNKRIRHFVNMNEGIRYAQNNNKIIMKEGYFQNE